MNNIINMYFNYIIMRYIIQVEGGKIMMKKTLFDPEEILKAFNKAIKENKIHEPSSVYIDKDGKIIRTRTKKKKVK